MIPLLEEKMKLKKELYKEHVTSPDINEKDVKEDEILFEIYLKLEQPDENVIICPVCGLQVKSKRALSFHKYNVHQVKPSNCNVCGKSCPNQRRLNQHIRYHEKKTCEICQKDISAAYIKKHLKICSSDLEQPQKFQCSICKFHSTSKSGLANHTKTHDNGTAVEPGQRFKCFECDYYSCDKSNIRRHVRLIHLTEKHPCHLCTKKFNSLEACERHIRITHDIPVAAKKDILYECSKCIFKSKWKSSAIKHKLMHLRQNVKRPKNFYGRTYQERSLAPCKLL